MGRESLLLLALPLLLVAAGGGGDPLDSVRDEDYEPPEDFPKSKGWADPAAAGEIWGRARRLEDAGILPGFLAPFLLAVAWTESRGNANAQNGTSANAARGWFQLRPASGLPWEFSDRSKYPADLLKNKDWAVAAAAWYAVRLLPFADKDQLVDALALRRGWALPRLVSDVDEVAVVDNPKFPNPGDRSRYTRRNFAEALERTGIGEDFMYEPVPRPTGWSDMRHALALLGVQNV